MMIRTEAQQKRLKDALARILAGKRIRLPAGPVLVSRSGWLYIYEQRTTLRACQALAHHKHRWTADDVQLLCAVVQDARRSGRLWLWVWDSDRGVHVIEPAGTDIDALDQRLTRRFPFGFTHGREAA